MTSSRSLNPFVFSQTFESTGETVLRLRQPLRWWRKRQFNRYLAPTGVGRNGIAIVDDPEASRLFDRMDYWDSYGSVVA